MSRTSPTILVGSKETSWFGRAWLTVCLGLSLLTDVTFAVQVSPQSKDVQDGYNTESPLNIDVNRYSFDLDFTQTFPNGEIQVQQTIEFYAYALDWS